MSANNKYTRVVIAVCLGAITNGVLNRFADILALPVFLDTTCTIVNAAIFGPLAGVATGALSNVANEILGGFPGYHIAFAPVNMASGLIVGLMRSLDRFESVVDAVSSLALVALTNAILGTIIVNIVFQGGIYKPVDMITSSLVLTGQSIWTASFLTRVPINLVDKAPGILAAFILARRFSHPSPADSDQHEYKHP
jgi:energy-coupling factor transport system substrate-specific component